MIRSFFTPENMFGNLNRLEREMSDLFEAWPWPTSIRAGAVRGYPPVNVGVTAEQVEVYVFAAGLDSDSLDLSLQQNLLTIAAKRETDTKSKGKVHRRERFSGEFRRVLSLPEDVDPDRVDAQYRNGVLRIQIARRKAVQPRKIQVN